MIEEIIWDTIVEIEKVLGHQISDDHCEIIAEAIEDWAMYVEEDAL